MKENGTWAILEFQFYLKVGGETEREIVGLIKALFASQHNFLENNSQDGKL